MSEIRPPVSPPSENRPATASFFHAVGAVLSAFVGIRKRPAADRDHVAIKPAHVVIAGVISGLLFIALLITVVRLVVAR